MLHSPRELEIFFSMSTYDIVKLRCDFSRTAELAGTACYRVKWKDQFASMIGYLTTCLPGMLEFDACDFYLTEFYLPASQQLKLRYTMTNWNQMMFWFIHNEVLLLHITLFAWQTECSGGKSRPYNI